MGFKRLAAVFALAIAISPSAAAFPQEAAYAGGDLYLSGGRALTDSDFFLYFQYMELSRQNIGKDALDSFASRNKVSAVDLDSLSVRIKYGQLIIDNPLLARSLEATYGPAIVPNADERELFGKYSAELKRHQPAQ
jgi:hypothetical protein